MSSQERLHTATQLLNRLGAGEARVAEELAPLVYEELRALADAAMRNAAKQTLQPTALVSEAWLRFAGEGARFENRHQFYALAAKIRTNRLPNTSILEITATSTNPREARDLALAAADVEHPVTTGQLGDRQRQDLLDVFRVGALGEPALPPVGVLLPKILFVSQAALMMSSRVRLPSRAPRRIL